MDGGFDTQAMIERGRDIARDIRTSDAYPAIVGGIAGGIAGALVAAIIASRYEHKSASSSHSTASQRGGIAVRDMVQLLGVVAGLVKQAREWYYQERARR